MPRPATEAVDLTLILPDRIGSLATAFAVLGDAGVNVRGHGGFPAWAGEGILHLTVDDPAAARSSLHKAGIEVRDERDVLVVPVDDRPGALAAVLGRIAEAGVNIDLTYSLADGAVAIGVNDLRRAARAVAPDSSAAVIQDD